VERLDACHAVEAHQPLERVTPDLLQERDVSVERVEQRHLVVRPLLREAVDVPGQDPHSLSHESHGTRAPLAPVRSAHIT